MLLEGLEFNSYNWSIENLKLEFIKHSESFSQKQRAGFEKPFHSHVFYELIFSAEDRSAEFMYDNKKILLQKNCFAVIAPYYKHRMDIYRREDLFSLGFLFKLDNKREATRQDLYRLFCEAFAEKDCIVGYGDDMLAELCMRVKYYSEMQDQLAEGSMVASFLLVLLHILRLMQNKMLVGGFDIVTTESENGGKRSTRIPSDIAGKINNILSDGFMTDVTSEELSRQYYISAKQINRYIYNQYGQTFMQRKIALRMIYAEKLLRETNLSIQEISEKIGYHSINSFYSAFKVVYGVTPNRYRMGERSAPES